MRNKAERNHNTWNKIFRKMKLIKSKNYSEYEGSVKEFMEQPHRLAKDKLEGRYTNRHTNNKMKRHIPGNYQKAHDYNTHDQRLLDAMEYEENENC